MSLYSLAPRSPLIANICASIIESIKVKPKFEEDCIWLAKNVVTLTEFPYVEISDEDRLDYEQMYGISVSEQINLELSFIRNPFDSFCLDTGLKSDSRYLSEKRLLGSKDVKNIQSKENKPQTNIQQTKPTKAKENTNKEKETFKKIKAILSHTKLFYRCNNAIWPRVLFDTYQSSYGNSYFTNQVVWDKNCYYMQHIPRIQTHPFEDYL
jgi:hypothetical protein